MPVPGARRRLLPAALALLAGAAALWAAVPRCGPPDEPAMTHAALLADLVAPPPGWAPAAGCPPRPARCRLTDVFDEVLVISLPRRATLARARAQLRALRVPHTVVRGFDGRDPTVAALHARDRGSFKNPEQFALALTTLAYLEYAARRATGRLLVLEDDVIFHRSFPDAFDAAMARVGSNWSVLMLGASQMHGWTPHNLREARQNGYYSQLLPGSTPFGNFAYGLNRSSAARLAREMAALQRPLDNLSKFGPGYSNDPGGFFVIFPNIVIADVRSSDLRKPLDQVEFAKRCHWNLEDFDLDTGYVGGDGEPRLEARPSTHEVLDALEPLADGNRTANATDANPTPPVADPRDAGAGPTPDFHAFAAALASPGARVDGGVWALGNATLAFPDDPVPLNRAPRPLPTCETLAASNIYAPRCRLGALNSTWPLLVTATPRSGTVAVQTALRSLGVLATDDWHDPGGHGTVSWMMAFRDDRQFGPARTKGGRFRVAVHLVREPLASLASLCTEPVFLPEYGAFLGRHVPLDLRPHARTRRRVPLLMQFWVEWHAHLDRLGLYVVRTEDPGAPHRIAAYAAAGTARRLVRRAGPPTNASATGHANATGFVNSRAHRPPFTWDELWSADAGYARRAWDMARAYGYEYPGVGFGSLRRVPVPECDTVLGRCPSCPEEWKKETGGG
ncbi:hypothetical protein DFJ74DRAFT_769222 [Hyaloraphidium curvatum]|nr:hypothetical protein DFJ74DRAFT_769222 [Hyaloraphidium curvatum]